MTFRPLDFSRASPLDLFEPVSRLAGHDSHEIARLWLAGYYAKRTCRWRGWTARWRGWLASFAPYFRWELFWRTECGCSMLVFSIRATIVGARIFIKVTGSELVKP